MACAISCINSARSFHKSFAFSCSSVKAGRGVLRDVFMALSVFRRCDGSHFWVRKPLNLSQMTGAQL
jgi:hypothetical protein